MTERPVGPEDVAAAIRAHQAPSEVVDEHGVPEAADESEDADTSPDGAE